MAEGAKILNRFNCDGCHVLEMPKFTIAKGTKVAEAMPDFKGNLRSSYKRAPTIIWPSSIPTLKYDPKKNLGPNEIEQELEIGKDDGEEITIEGMPTGLSENELTVQLWQPVKIRGYTFSVADNLTLDQTTDREDAGRRGRLRRSCTRPIRTSGPTRRSRRSGTGCRRRCCVKETRCRPHG